MSESAKSDRVLRVQTVLYGASLAHVWRLLRAVDAAARKVLDSHLVGHVDWALGDSSATRRLLGADLVDMNNATHSLENVSYDFFGENLGSSGGQNRLASADESDIIFVLNPDTYPAPDALLELVRTLDGDRVGIAESRQIPLEHPKEYDAQSGDTSWASGACMMIRSEIFRDLGGFDHEHFLLHCDDVDLSWRVRAAGWRVVTAPLSTIFHDKRPTRDANWPMPDHERYHSVLGRLMLATRWGRPDIVDETVAYIEAHGDEVTRGAVAEFVQRKREGRVPDPIGDPTVAQFVDGEYAVHRF